MVKTFTDELLQRPEVPIVIMDPDVKNEAAIRCYQKAGFQIVREMATAEGAILLLK